MKKINLTILLLVLLSCLALSAMEFNIQNNNNLKIHSKKKLVFKEFPEKFTVDLVSSDVKIIASKDKNYSILIDYYEYTKGDANFGVVNSKFNYSSKSKKGVAIQTVIAYVPENCQITAETVSGDILVSDINKTSSLLINTTSGDVALSHITNIASVSIQTVSGDASVNNCSNIPSLKTDTVSGDITISDLKSVNDLIHNSSSGSLTIGNAFIKNISSDLVSGDIKISNSTVYSLDAESVSGDITVSGSKINKKNFDSVSGDIYIN